MSLRIRSERYSSSKRDSKSDNLRKHKKMRVISRKMKRKTSQKGYLFEDPSIRGEAHSLWEAEDIYDEDDFRDC